MHALCNLSQGLADPVTGIGNLQPFTGFWRGRTHERLVKLQFSCALRNLQPYRDWRGRTHERLAKLKVLMCIEAKFATLHRDWRGRTHERKVKLLLLMRIDAKFATLHRDWGWAPDLRRRGGLRGASRGASRGGLRVTPLRGS